MFIFAVALAIILGLSVIGCIISGESPVFPFILLVFFTLYIMGVGK